MEQKTTERIHEDLIHLKGAEKCIFRKNELLFRQDEQVEYIYYLVSGTVHRERQSSKGNESMIMGKRVGISSKRELIRTLIGILTLYTSEGVRSSRYNFIAKTRCVCYRIPADSLTAYLRQQPELLEQTIALAVLEMRHVMDMLEYRKEGSSAMYLCRLLMEQSTNANGRMIVPKQHTNVEISKYLGIHKVIVARMIRALKEEGIMERTSEGLWIKNSAQLEQYALGKAVLKYK